MAYTTIWISAPYSHSILISITNSCNVSSLAPLHIFPFSHHCRACLLAVCDQCSSQRLELHKKDRLCAPCYTLNLVRGLSISINTIFLYRPLLSLKHRAKIEPNPRPAPVVVSKCTFDILSSCDLNDVLFTACKRWWLDFCGNKAIEWKIGEKWVWEERNVTRNAHPVVILSEHGY